MTSDWVGGAEVELPKPEFLYALDQLAVIFDCTIDQVIECVRFVGSPLDREPSEIEPMKAYRLPLNEPTATDAADRHYAWRVPESEVRAFMKELGIIAR